MLMLMLLLVLLLLCDLSTIAIYLLSPKFDGLIRLRTVRLSCACIYLFIYSPINIQLNCQSCFSLLLYLFDKTINKIYRLID